MAKGIRKKMKGYFKKGHVRTGCKGISDKNVGTEKCDQVRYIRLTSSQQSMVEENPILPAALENEGGSDNNGPAFKFLREKKPLSPEQNIPQTRDEIQRKESQSYRLFHCGKLWQMMNEVTKEHFHRNPRCKGTLDFDFQKEEQWGLCWRECAFCSKCSYTSKMYKLYSEVESRRRGRKSATANVGMNVAMTQTPVGVTGVRKLLLGSNIPAPAKSSMQRTAKIVNKKIEKVNIQDMKQRRDELKLINKARGKPETEIAVQADGTYNNSLWSGVTRTPYQPATQMTYLVAENVTDKHQIINLELVNKLCSKHGYHTQESEACDIKSGDCSATACIETSIGNEKRWARLAFEDLLEDGLSVKYVTTDQDTAAHMAATALFEEGMTNTEPVHQVDIRHLSASHRKQMKNSIDVLAMMPGKTIQYRQYLRNRFATDMSKRCNAEFQAIYRNEEGNFRNILHKTDLATNAIKRCYSILL